LLDRDESKTEIGPVSCRRARAAKTQQDRRNSALE